MSEAMSEFMCLPRDMQKEILKEQGIVSTLTHSPKQVAKHFIKWRASHGGSDVAKVVELKPKQEVKAKAPSKSNLRAAVFAELEAGTALKAICAKFDITYANAHYYKRAWKKG